MTIDTPNFERRAFRLEVEKLIKDIDPTESKLVEFQMDAVRSDFDLTKYEMKKKGATNES